MTFSITGKHMELGGALSQHAEESVRNIVQKHYNVPVESAVVMGKRGHLYITDVSVHVKHGLVLRSHAEADSPYSSLDSAVSKLGTLLHKNKDRENSLKKEHSKTNNLSSDDVFKVSVNKQCCRAGDETTDKVAPLIIAELSDHLPSLTPVQAVEYMEELKTNILIFRNIKHNGVNVVYVRDDGNVGWIDPDHM